MIFSSQADMAAERAWLKIGNTMVAGNAAQDDTGRGQDRRLAIGTAKIG
jgi:hypothetical protein